MLMHYEQKHFNAVELRGLVGGGGGGGLAVQ